MSRSPAGPSEGSQVTFSVIKVPLTYYAHLLEEETSVTIVEREVERDEVAELRVGVELEEDVFPRRALEGRCQVGLDADPVAVSVEQRLDGLLADVAAVSAEGEVVGAVAASLDLRPAGAHRA